MGNRFARFITRNWLLAGIGIAMLLAWLAPDIGQTFNNWGVKEIAMVGIFLLSGLTLRMGHVLEDVRQWRCHLAIQLAVFGLMPLAVIATTGWIDDGPLKYGVCLVAVLPTTISSCVVFTGLAGGRTACALLNAVAGNLLGVVLSPLLLGLLIGKGADAALVNPAQTMVKLALLVLLPFVIGQLVGCGMLKLPAPVGKVQRNIAQTFILLIMLCAFSSSSWSEIARSDLKMLWTCFFYLAVLHLVLIAVVIAVLRLIGLAPRESAAVFFCATQKTLAFGLPLAVAFFENTDVAIAIVILPITFYHFFQLVLGTFLVPYWEKRTASASPN